MMSVIRPLSYLYLRSCPFIFNYLGDLAGLSSVDYLAYWGYGTSISTLIVALLGPVLGTVADTRNYKKKLFTGAMLIGAVSCVLLGLASTWLVFLIIFVIAKVGYSASLIFYDAMLTDITTENRMDTVSSHGYAWGYIGSCIPFGIGLVLVLGGSSFGLSMPLAMSLTFAMIAIWWVVMSLPLLRRYQQKFYVDHPSHIFQNSLGRLWNTLKKAQKNKKILWFLLAFFFYIDGVYTIIDMATAYGQALGLDSTGLLIALLMTQIVAFPCSITFGRLSKKYDPKQLITICILALYRYCHLCPVHVHSASLLDPWPFIVGMFQGGIQALSRSYFAKIIPNENAGEYFGIMDICGKGASFLGTAIISIASQVTGNINIGVGMLTILFILGLLFFRKSAKLA